MVAPSIGVAKSPAACATSQRHSTRAFSLSKPMLFPSKNNNVFVYRFERLLRRKRDQHVSIALKIMQRHQINQQLR